MVSYGSIGRRHIGNLRFLCPAAQIGVLRTNTPMGAATESLPEGINVQFFELDDALAFAPDAVVVASPASTHLYYALAFIARGVPVLVEKPLADTTRGLRELVAKAAEHQVRAAVAYNLRYKPSLQHVRQQVLTGSIGEVLSVRAEVGQYLPDWRPGTRYQDNVSAQAALGGGALLELSHELDYLYWMFGLPHSVTARGGRLSALDLDVEDLVELLLEYENPRRLVSVHLDFIQRVPHRFCRLIGSQGTLVWDAIKDVVEIYRVATGQWDRTEFPTLDRNQAYLDEIRDFLFATDATMGKLPDLSAAYDVVAIVEAAKDSNASGKTIRIQGYEQQTG
ncbi:Gfo/Idh/MocA family protein [Rhodoferax sp.]|uniref:Gfo/Idh/MocA family protein n=1 Tax=Rhodoferax sp. TaxID=50421 RepID=UPI002715B47A|nr:Gfo/Idh/MocA family oxidoreductase [Rhodoferax sp.]MDO8319257.1 Gfo/Idh/MocA family oxidoreductase [Rhodoferax sp.]MDP2680622.1 Gfo/Idh/MocA family oxidoreductase [Rhodoferax sp.]